MQDGPADKSYGIHVAKLAGMPDDLLKRANVILQGLEENSNELNSSVKTSLNQQVETEVETEEPKEVTETDQVDEQLALFQTSEPSVQQVIAEQLKDLNLMDMTPMEVMNQIYKWQKKLQK